MNSKKYFGFLFALVVVLVGLLNVTQPAYGSDFSTPSLLPQPWQENLQRLKSIVAVR